MSEGEKGISLNLEEASQQGNGVVSHALYPTRTSYKGFWVDGGPQRGPGGGRLGRGGSSAGTWRGQAGQLTYEWLHGAVDMFVLFEAGGCGKGLAAVGTGMGPGTNVL